MSLFSFNIHFETTFYKIMNLEKVFSQ
jgi:hypothetical protein